MSERETSAQDFALLMILKNQADLAVLIANAFNWPHETRVRLSRRIEGHAKIGMDALEQTGPRQEKAP